MQFFITNDKPNVTGLVLAGSADFKTELGQSDMFDQVCDKHCLLHLFYSCYSLRDLCVIRQLILEVP